MSHKTTRTKRDQWMTVSQAARALGKSRPGVLAMIARGELNADERAGYTFVARGDVELLASEMEQAATAA